MKTLFFLGHPAHYHLFKHTIWGLKQKGHDVRIYIKTKDILEALLRETRLEYTNVLPEGRKSSRVAILFGVLKRDWRLLKLLYNNRVDLMVGSEPSLTHIGKMLQIPTLYFAEDDVRVTPQIANNITFPFATHIISPTSCELMSWSKKKIAYQGYQKLAYLHPNRFTPQLERISDVIDINERNFLIRLSNLSAHHDFGLFGLNNDLVVRITQILSEHGNVFISAEGRLPSALKKYELRTNLKDIHHILSFTELLISDSQSMSVEAAMLGTPSIRFSDFAGKISVLEELEYKYGLTYGIRPSNPEKLIRTIKKLISTPNLKDVWQHLRWKMLSEKIDVTAFMVWLIENYPKSVRLIKNNPEYQFKFK